MEDLNFGFAFTITLLAGLATGIGSLVALFARKTNTTLLSFSLGLSAGVMLYVSFVELLNHGNEALIASHGHYLGSIYSLLALFAGMGFIAIIDALIPSETNPHEARCVEQLGADCNKRGLTRMGLMSALAIAIHNFPEGIATFASAAEDPSLGLAVGVAVAIHNIPEGIAVSVPIYYATGSRHKAFWYSLLSGLAEPLGGVIAFALLMPFITPELIGALLSGVAGVMIYIAIDELLPAAREYGKAHISIYGLALGMAIMAASLIILE
ncbi:MAG: zinc transporter ZupT [Rikenellaceae bacterium]